MLSTLLTSQFVERVWRRVNDALRCLEHCQGPLLDNEKLKKGAWNVAKLWMTFQFWGVAGDRKDWKEEEEVEREASDLASCTTRRCAMIMRTSYRTRLGSKTRRGWISGEAGQQHGAGGRCFGSFSRPLQEWGARALPAQFR